MRVEFLRTDRTFNSNFAGKIAGGDNGKGYIVIEIDGVGYYAHRLAWFYTTGEWPPDQIDHEGRDRKNNRFLNLRKADNARNQMNAPRPHRKVAPYRGLAFHKDNVYKQWSANITVNKKRRSLGYFCTPEEAHAAYCVAAKAEHGEFASFD